MLPSGLTVLFVHCDFPAQFNSLASHFLNCPGVNVAVICQEGRGTPYPGVCYSCYREVGPLPASAYPSARVVEAHIRRATAALEAAWRLRSQGVKPDIIYVHPGWGDGLFLKQAFPEARYIVYCEFYYKPVGADVGFDPEFPLPVGLESVLTMQNTPTLQAVSGCHAAISPTLWQKSLFPPRWQEGIEVIHEGVDTDLVRPNPTAELSLGPGIPPLRAGEEIVTFISRDLEPYRGFHTFMRALPDLLARRPGCRVLVVGRDGPGYGPPAPPGSTWRQTLLAANPVDMSRVNFLGSVPYHIFLKLLQISACHIYLSYPFVLSWSCIEALSAGCLLVGSATPPVMEVLEHGVNGLLVDFFDPSALAETVADALENQEQYIPLRHAARETAVRRFDHRSVCLPAHLRLVQRVLEA